MTVISKIGDNQRSKRTISKVIVHVSDSAWGDVEAIRRWHIQRGWSDIGYHYVITNGRRTARPEYVLADDGDVEPR